MKVERLSALKIKVTLRENELDEYGLDYESLSYANESTKQLVEDILLYLYNEENFVRNGHRLMIKKACRKKTEDAFFFFLLDSRHTDDDEDFTSPVIMKTDDCNALLCLIERLSERTDKSEYKICLYREESGYYLTIDNIYSSVSPDIISVLLEYGEIIAQGRFAFSIINEHCKIISADVLSHCGD